MELVHPCTRPTDDLAISMVGAGRFELPTPTTPLWCATRLRYAPTAIVKCEGGNDTYRVAYRKDIFLTPEDFKNLFKFQAQLLNDLLALANVRLRIVARQSLPGAADGEAIVIQQTANLTND